MSALSAADLTATYPGQPGARPALEDVNLTLQVGERLLLLGPNGAGKSTFIRVFAGLMHVGRGQALIDGKPAPLARGLVGVVSHATYLYEELTAAENLRFYAELYSVRRPLERAMTLLENVGLAHLANEPVGRLSRGQQQRVAIARALLHDPPVLLLDEPDAGLDPAAFALIVDLTCAGRRTVVLTTHNLANGLAIGTRVGVLSQGHLVHEQATASAVDASPLADLLEQLART